MEASENRNETGTDEARRPTALETLKKAGEDRITMLSDGIFAIAITLLVLDIRIPDGVANYEAFKEALTDDFFDGTLFYAITFAVLAAYWMNHRRLMNIVERIDGIFLWLNLLFLAFVAFFPVVSNLLKFSQFPEAVVIYTVVLAGCGYSSLLLWIYAFKNHRLVSVDRAIHHNASRFIGVSIIPTFLLLTLFLLFVPYFRSSPSDLFYTWFLLPVVNIIWRVGSTKKDKMD
ncbi:hypothetical protein KSF_093460 [Reticulibacter mediterranei]|uniref:DUF1211 domain-containing protein n=1 Tax=Reticulibacter mediterranei TaxID=2778369 RepID=A0A8J3IVH2_9CHLR|nr:TMEM175 family protein [Reticulibacter mediterranei]GHO99298.1 hypothetical protein KSF_093460 [Reticulibacter mediterranei]